MKRFRFKLEAVLNARRTSENEALRSLGEAQRAFQLEIAQKEELHEDLRNALIRREQIGQTPTLVSEIHAEQSFVSGTKQRIVQADQAIFRASRLVDKVMKLYLQARRQTRMIEILYDKAYQDFKVELAHQERKEMDDLMVMRTRLKEEAE